MIQSLPNPNDTHLPTTHLTFHPHDLYQPLLLPLHPSLDLHHHLTIHLLPHAHAHIILSDLLDAPAPPDTFRHFALFAQLDAHAHLRLTSLALNDASADNAFHFFLNDQHASLDLAHLSVLAHDHFLSISSSIHHNAPHTASKQLAKAILLDSAHSTFHGAIHVAHNAPHSSALQTHRSLSLSPDARVSAQPHLSILNHDVRCAHAASAGQLDPNALFYLLTRGIPPALATSLLAHAFLNDILDDIPLPDFRQRARQRIQLLLPSLASRHP